jgi:hypothetical protein
MKLLSVNFNMETDKDKVFGKVLMMDPLEAYEFSLITGADYMVDPIGYSVKGRMEVAIHRSVFQNGGFIYTPGLFSRDIKGKLIQGDSIKTQYAKHPELFVGKKKLIILDVQDNSCIEGAVYKKIVNAGLKPSDYLLYKSFNNGSNNEPLYEYLASRLFADKNMITENQVPWFNQNYIYNGKKINGGIPDFSAFQTDDLNIISGEFNIDFVSIQTVSGTFLTDGKPRKRINPGYKLIIGEAKVSKSSVSAATSQLQKYSSTCLPNELYYLIPDLEKSDYQESGVFNIDANYCSSIKTSVLNHKIDVESQKTDSEWISNITKMYLLSNLEFENIVEFIVQKLDLRNGVDITSKDLVEAVCSSDMAEISSFVRKNIIYREK